MVFIDDERAAAHLSATIQIDGMLRYMLAQQHNPRTAFELHRLIELNDAAMSVVCDDMVQTGELHEVIGPIPAELIPERVEQRLLGLDIARTGLLQPGAQSPQ